MAKKAVLEMMLISRTGSSRSNRRGFTLHELLVTLIISVVMCAVVAVAIVPMMDEVRLRAVTSMAIGQLQYARSYAIANRTPTAVFFDTTHLGVSVVSVPNASSSSGTTTTTTSIPTTVTTTVDTSSGTNWQPVTTPAAFFQALPVGITITDVSLNDAIGVDMSSTAATYTSAPTISVVPVVNGTGDEGQIITFSALGQSEDASITFEDTRGETRTILVDAITGRCELANTNNDQTTSTLPNP